jgi:predicted DNA-binding transcriptional regulator YafY
MGRASDAQKAERLNRARHLLGRFNLPQAAGKRARECSISPRQAYRYLQQAQHLKEPVPIGDAKSAFTVKLSQGVIAKVRRYAATAGLSIGEVVTRALVAWLRRERGRG